MTRVVAIVVLGAAAAADQALAVLVVYLAVAVLALGGVAALAYGTRDLHDAAAEWAAEAPPSTATPDEVSELVRRVGDGVPAGLPVDAPVWIADDRPGVYAHRLTAEALSTVDGHPVVRIRAVDQIPVKVRFGLVVPADAALARGMRWCPTCWPPAGAPPAELPRRRRIR